jgi:hypothetical protein
MKVCSSLILKCLMGIVGFFFFLWCWGQTQGLTCTSQALYH